MLSLLGALHERLLPLLAMRLSHSMLHPMDWGMTELIVLGVVSQLGLEAYSHLLPRVLDGGQYLAARGKPLKEFATIDRVFVAISRFAIVVMTFHYIQFMACSPNVVWSLGQVFEPQQ